MNVADASVITEHLEWRFDSQVLHFTTLSVHNIALFILQPGCYESGGTLGLTTFYKVFPRENFCAVEMLFIDLYRTIIINFISVEHISTRLGHIMTDSFCVFLYPPSSAQTIFPHFVSLPCPLGSWLQMWFYVSIFFLYCVENSAIWFCPLNIGYMMHVL